MIIYSLLEGSGTEKWIGVGAGIGIIIISSFITQRHMLTLTGLAVFRRRFIFAGKLVVAVRVYIIRILYST